MQASLLADDGLPFAPLAGWLGYYVTHALQADAAPPWFVGIVMLVLTGLLIPTAGWLRARSDGRQRQTEKMAERREKREDDRQAAFERLVTTLGDITLEVATMNQQHGALIKKLDDLPARIVKQCNGN